VALTTSRSYPAPPGCCRGSVPREPETLRSSDRADPESTIAKLLLRYYDPTGGKITIDGHDLRDITRASLREATGLVLQETLLMHTSVEENIAYGRPGADHEEILRAARAADADEFISTLPEGYATVVGQKGRRLSGGQRQRIALARWSGSAGPDPRRANDGMTGACAGP
jgi:ABC-type transport system involved in Fe-S cluster assembly fused permease/ATPase subunit